MKKSDFQKLHKQLQKSVASMLQKYTAQEIIGELFYQAYGLTDESGSFEQTVVSELTERGYNVIKTTSLKEQMELEEWVARQYPKMNMRENLFLQTI